MNQVTKELEEKNESIKRFVSVLKIITYEKKKEKEISKIIDYLKEQVYLRDFELVDDCYKIFFQEIYDFFYQKELLSKYYQIMVEYIDNILIDKGNLNTFIEGLRSLLKIIDKSSISLQEADILDLEKRIKIKKYNSSTLTQKVM